MVSIVIPTYNEAKNIRELVRRIARQFAKEINWEVVVVDDYSTDETWETLQKVKDRYPLRIFRKQGKRGKAYSLFEGFEKASGEILAMIDADLQYPPQEIPRMAAALDKKTDVIVAKQI